MAASYDTSHDWRRYVASTPEVLRGKPRINGTRIPVALVLGYLASGVIWRRAQTSTQFRRNFPTFGRST